MTSNRPPAIATWLLKHLGCSPNNEAVIGDLHERYQLRPRPAWYWRQAIIAIGKSLFSEIARHKLQAAGALVIGWAALICVWWISAPLVRNADVRVHHACTFFWFIAGITSGGAIGLLTNRSKRAMIFLYLASVLVFLMFIHPRPSTTYSSIYWADAIVLSVSIVLGALPMRVPYAPLRNASRTSL